MRKTIELMGHKFTLRSWTYGMKQRALKAATSWVEVKGELQPDVDPYVLNDNMLLECVENWDIHDDQGNTLEVTITNIHGIEPPELVEQLINEVQRINGVTLEERKKS